MSEPSSMNSSSPQKKTEATKKDKVSTNRLISFFLQTIAPTLKTETAKTNALLSVVLLIGIIITVVPSAFHLISYLLTTTFNFVITVVGATRPLLSVPELMQDKTPFIMFIILMGQVVFCLIIVFVWEIISSSSRK